MAPSGSSSAKSLNVPRKYLGLRKKMPDASSFASRLSDCFILSSSKNLRCTLCSCYSDVEITLLHLTGVRLVVRISGLQQLGRLSFWLYVPAYGSGATAPQLQTHQRCHVLDPVSDRVLADHVGFGIRVLMPLCDRGVRPLGDLI
jgi:hypothetical protein